MDRLTKIVPLILLTATIAITSAPDWVPFYVAAIYGEDATVLGKPENFREACEKPAKSERMTCKLRYRIPRALITSNNSQFEAVGLGYLISATNIYCSNTDSDSVSYGDLTSPARAQELLRIYQVVDLQKINCKEDLIVDVYGPPQFSRSGSTGSVVIVGTLNSIVSTKYISEFFQVALYFVLATSLLAIFLLSGITKAFADSHSSSFGYAFEKLLPAWVLFGLLRSGIIEIAIPYITDSIVFIRLRNFVSIWAHLGTAYYMFRSTVHFRMERSSWSKVPDAAFYIALLSSATFVFTDHYANILLIGSIIAVVLSVAAFMNLHEPTFIFFGALLGLEIAKVLSVLQFPSGMTTLVFASAALLAMFVDRIKKSKSVVDMIEWSRRAMRLKEVSDLRDSLAPIFDMLPIIQLDFYLVFSADRVLKISISYDGRNVIQDQSLIGTIPSFVAPTFNLGTEYSDIDINSVLFEELNSDKLVSFRNTNVGYCSLFPIESNGGQGAGIISVLSPAPLVNSSIQAAELKVFYETLQRCSKKIHIILRHEHTYSWLSRSKVLAEELASKQLDTNASQAKLLEELVAKIDSKLGTRSAYLKYHHEDGHRLTLETRGSISDDAYKVFKNTPWRALPGNNQGPLAVTIHQQRVICVSNIDLILPKLHSASQEYFALSQAKSLALIPISDTNDGKITGILWMEIDEYGYFSDASVDGLQIISSAFTGLMRNYSSNRMLTSTLGRIVPTAALKLIESNQPLNKQQRGYLVLIDIRGSTEISHRIGAELWTHFVKEISQRINSSVEDIGGNVFKVVWDCFYILFPSGDITDNLEKEIVNLCARVDKMITDELLSHCLISKQVEYSTRVVIEFGEISTGVQNQEYTITGQAMPMASKLEQTAKSQAGWLFFRSGETLRWSDSKISAVRHPSTGDQICMMVHPPIVREQIDVRTKKVA